MLAVLFSAGGIFTAPMAADSAALAALSAQGAHRLEVAYEGLVPVPVLGRIKAATASINAWIGPTGYNANTRAQAAGIVDWFVDYNLFISSTGRVTPAGLMPGHYDSNNQDGRKNRHVTVDFNPTEVLTKVTPKFGDYGYPPATPEQKLEAMDPVSAILNLALASNATAANPCGGPMRAFDGKQRFDLKLTFDSRISYKSAVYSGPALVCNVEYVEIAGFKAKTAEKKAEDKADMMWTNLVLAELPDGLRPPLKIEARSKKRGKMTVQATRLNYGLAK